jgi:GDPmannose 4,6-dehydratase/GDP-4-dehydro-6-deoxy-D-mannose reductase
VNIAITGLSGSGGSYLAEHILSINNVDHSIWGTTRWHSTGNQSNLHNLEGKINLLECDLTDLSSTIRFIRKAQPDLIFHLAAYANVRTAFENPISVTWNNVSSTQNLLESLRILGISPTFVLCSTSEVYGQVNQESIPIREIQTLKPRSPYAASKASQEMMCNAYYESFGIPVIITRMFTYVNPRRHDLFATSFARQIALIEMGKLNKLRHGNLDSIRTLIDVRDAMDCYWKVANLGKPGEAYNLGGTFTASVGDVLKMLIEKSSNEIECELDPSLLRPADVTLQVPDCSKFLNL